MTFPAPMPPQAQMPPTPPPLHTGPATAKWPRRFYAAVLLAGPVVVFLFIELTGTSGTVAEVVGTIIGIIWLLGFLVAPVLGLVDAIRKLASGDADGLRRGAIMVKLSAMPLFILNFVFVAAFALVLQIVASLFAAGAVLALFNAFGVTIIIALTYLTMLPTSAHGWAALIWLRRHKAVTNTFFIVNAILHAIFVVDILSSLIVAGRVRDALNSGRQPSPQHGPAARNPQ